MTEKQKNWAGNFEYSATNLHLPKSVEDVQAIVKNSNKVKGLGKRHSFNHIADSAEDILSLKQLDQVLSLDAHRQTVTVEAGITYGQLSEYLNGEGFALHNMASLPHISVIGACSTATHGSGDKNGNLATAISALEFVTADGEIVPLSREQNKEQFQGAVVGLGAIGVVTKVTLDIMLRFDMRQDVYLNLPLSQLVAHVDDILSSAYSVSLFTNWQGEHINQVWLKSRISDDVPWLGKPEFFGATQASRPVHPLEEMSAENCTEQMGITGSWQDRLPHFRMDFIASKGDELQSEYFVAREHAASAIKAMSQLGEHFAPLLFASEIRTIAADDLWMSTCYKQDSIALHFTWKRDWSALQKVLPLIEEQLAPYNARTHWGKMFTMPPDQVQAHYEKLADFRALLNHYDPQGKFRNAFLDKYIFGEY